MCRHRRAPSAWHIVSAQKMSIIITLMTPWSGELAGPSPGSPELFVGLKGASVTLRSSLGEIIACFLFGEPETLFLLDDYGVRLGLRRRGV